MAKDLFDSYPSTKKLFESANKTISDPHLGLDDVMFKGPEETLTLTKWTQPAVLTHSLAVWMILKEADRLDDVQVTLGHSLGEYCSLVAAGAISFQDAVRIVVSYSCQLETTYTTQRKRGEWMQEATNALGFPTGMRVVFPRDGQFEATIQAIKAHKSHPVFVANINSPTQVVLSGSLDGLKEVIQTLISEKLISRRVSDLPVSAPFHSGFMTPVAAQMKEMLEDTPVQAPEIPIITNVTAKEETDPESLKQLACQQVDHTVQWHNSLLTAKAKGVQKWIILGPGKSMSNILSKTFPTDEIQLISSLEDIQKVLSKDEHE